MFKDLKPEIKLLLTVASIAVVLSVGGILLFRILNSPQMIAEPTNQDEAIMTQVLSPNGGETYQQGASIEIQWKASNEFDRVVVEAIRVETGKVDSFYGGPIVVEALSENDGFLIARIPDTLQLGDYVISVMNCPPHANDPYCINADLKEYGYDVSDFPFTVIEAPDTSTWQTYRNDEYGFEVKYPPVWSNNLGPLPDVFLFGHSGWSNERQVQIWVTSESNLDKFYDDKTKVCTKTFLANREAYRCGGIEQSFLYIETTDKGKYYFISWKGSEFLGNSDLLNQVLSTFRFID